MKDMYDFLIPFMRSLLRVRYYGTSLKTVKSINGYDIKLTQRSCEIVDQHFKNRTLIHLDTTVNESRIFRNTIITSRHRYIIPSINPLKKVESVDKDMLFNMSLTKHLPTYEHIMFAFELRKLLFEFDDPFGDEYHYRIMTIHPSFINLELLKNTEIP